MWSELAKLLVVPVVAGVASALATNYFAASFSFRRFRKEQWWTEKREAYHSIIKRLSEISFNAGAALVEQETYGQVKPSRVPERDKALSWSLQEIASSGAYIVSQATVKALEEFWHKREQGQSSDDVYKMIETDYDAANRALQIVRAEAHRDLGVEQ